MASAQTEGQLFEDAFLPIVSIDETTIANTDAFNSANNDQLPLITTLDESHSPKDQQNLAQNTIMEDEAAQDPTTSNVDGGLDDYSDHGPVAESEYEQVEDIVEEGQRQYDLRRQARDTKPSFANTWIDNDPTGYYNPDEERRQLRQRPKRPNPLLRSSFNPWDLEDNEGDSESPKERVAQVAPQLEVTLAFTSEAGRAAFEKHVTTLPAQLEPDERLYSERRLRRRDSGVDFSYTFRSRSAKKDRESDDLPEDLTGHPIARGCWECLALGLRCPLLDDDRAWPCTTCTDDKNECELIRASTYKRACEHCKSRKFGCSYTYTLDHEGPCEECARIKWRCVAGPAKEAIRERISYDRDWQNDPWQEPKPPKARKLPSCRRCRERDQPCSFSAGDKSEVCTGCDMANAECLPELETSQSSRKRKRASIKAKRPEHNDHAGGNVEPDNKLHDPIVVGDSSESNDDDGNLLRVPKKTKTKHLLTGAIDDSSSDDSDFETLLKKLSTDPATNPKRKQELRTRQTDSKPARDTEKGTLKSITTKFAHPIMFNYTGNEPCHFCSDIRFAMLGLAAVKVEVVVWNDGRGLEEVGGGHREQGIENTRMCISCTTKRMPMVMCGEHELRQLEGEYHAGGTASSKGRILGC